MREELCIKYGKKVQEILRQLQDDPKLEDLEIGYMLEAIKTNVRPYDFAKWLTDYRKIVGRIGA